jgi:hypothetical protein
MLSAAACGFSCRSIRVCFATIDAIVMCAPGGGVRRAQGRASGRAEGARVQRRGGRHHPLHRVAQVDEAAVADAQRAQAGVTVGQVGEGARVGGEQLGGVSTARPRKRPRASRWSSESVWSLSGTAKRASSSARRLATVASSEVDTFSVPSLEGDVRRGSARDAGPHLVRTRTTIGGIVVRRKGSSGKRRAHGKGERERSRGLGSGWVVLCLLSSN